MIKIGKNGKIYKYDELIVQIVKNRYLGDVERT